MIKRCFKYYNFSAKKPSALSFTAKTPVLNSFLIFCMFFCVPCKAQFNFERNIDSLKKAVSSNKNSSNVSAYFTIADNYMDLDQYDSAQTWLNKIASFLPFKEPSIAGYFLSSRQAEVYYYNGLQRLGLQESEKSLAIAKLLNDSLLLADAYNFIGLFYVNLDSFKTAIPYFKKGIIYTRQPPFPKKYLSLTKPHNLYGNLAEAYTKLEQFDSSIYYSQVSLRFAKQINWERGIAVAQNNLGDAFFKINQIDSSLSYFDKSLRMAKKGDDFDVELLSYGGIARSYHLSNDRVNALQNLDNGFRLITLKPSVNNLFVNHFLDDAIFLFKEYNLQDQLTNTLNKKIALLQKQIKSNNQQMSVILFASLQNENRVLGLEIEKVNQQNNIAKTRLYYLAALIFIGVVAFIFYRYAIIQKLQKSRLRNKISKDLHDDVGSSLSSLNVYSTVAVKVIDTNPTKAKEMLDKISEQSLLLMDNIGDIVWSMKTAKEETVNLSIKIKNFASDVLSAAEINYQINIDEIDDVRVSNITAKRNILMIIKEAVNNTIKYSEAKNVSITIKNINNTFMIEVKDDGKGFDVDAKKASGNGLTNMTKRAAELNGRVTIDSAPQMGTTLTALFPLNALNNTGW